MVAERIQDVTSHPAQIYIRHPVIGRFPFNTVAAVFPQVVRSTIKPDQLRPVGCRESGHGFLAHPIDPHLTRLQFTQTPPTDVPLGFINASCVK